MNSSAATSVPVSSVKVPKLPEFSGEAVVGGVEFDVWKYDLKCLLRSQVYPAHTILEAIRRSLKGKARLVLLHLGELATVGDILSELEGIYGNVHSTEKLKEQFYSAKQEVNESVADYSLRLEQLLSTSNLQLDPHSKNDMLRNRLWSGLRSPELRNVSRYKFESVSDFNTLRKELRVIEQELGSVVSVKPVGNKQPTETVGQHMSVVEHKMLQQLQELSTQMKQLSTRMGKLEEMSSKPGQGRGGPKSGSYSGNSSNSKPGDLNKKGPQSNGSQ
ncbi:uncharacterized protein LOC128231276 [Mya arenaria]|uniref:uncharacterized protein LOC128231276 n=1 Tax=Mya arenaria TaxID=6604 RepID=UPI0022E18F7B|nr:uncharacterized protein LOC128231276 [Mya arenaria]XP_052799857.1 uncharacterized protein LOC128231276 [Mya arenaria]XP_052799866.1 uncharacterized protein LOC128231276 [Mya arenaria]XP_052799874.1 uncharacterized protein LOC128231276 [Mya arenaria]